MNNLIRYFAIVVIAWVAFTACNRQQPRQIVDFDGDWKFLLGDDSLAYLPAYNDSAWRCLNLPHDWSIEGAFDEKNPSKPEGGGLPTGIGWYRKVFNSNFDSPSKTFIEFDGVYRNSEVWINGHYLGKRPFGYISFRYDLTPFLVKGKNVIAVKVDNSLQPNSRWYTGSGIYRHVRLVNVQPVHVDQWGTFVTTPQVTDSMAAVNVVVNIARAGNATVTVKTIIEDAMGETVGACEMKLDEGSDSLAVVTQSLTINDPKLWEIDRPYLYRAVCEVYADGKLSDVYKTPFGVRTFSFDAQKGFIINGKQTKIKGVCNHHDLGALGAAVNTRAMERQLEILKEMGCNAIRMSHNPPAPELLDLCDQMGFIVMDEAFDVWRKKKAKQDYHNEFKEWHERDLVDMIVRDRNHPSIMMWSIGNEIREQFDSTGIVITRELAGIVKRLDTTRPVVSALTENDPTKNFIYQSGALDLLGFNYKHEFYPKFPEVYPGQKFIASETMSALQTRGYYEMPSDSIQRWPTAHDAPLIGANDACLVSAYDNISSYWGSTHEETWKVIKKHDFISGMYVWTGFDYIGEPSPYPWPARSSYFGIVDLAGFPKDVYYMYQGEWTTKDVLHLFPHWNWKAGQTVDVWAYYNNADEVELFLNGKSQGIRKKSGDELHVMWRVKYEAGVIKAISRKDGKIVLEREVRTAGAPARIELTADRSVIGNDGRDLSFVTVRILDKDGVMVPDASNLVQFSIEGSGFIAGVDNGYQASMESFKAKERKAFNGMCLAIVQNNGKYGEVKLKASSAGLSDCMVSITCR